MLSRLRLLLTVAIIPIPAISAEEVSDESKAIEKIKLLGGHVERDDNLPRRTDAGTKELGEFKQLRFLNLRQTQVTDAGLMELKRGLTNFARVDLQGTKVTDAGVKQLQQSLPNAQIVR
jgi:hypothetical protein